MLDNNQVKHFFRTHQNREVKDVLSLFEKFSSLNIDIRLVGGCVRDIILGYIPSDFDFAIALPAEKIAQVFHENQDLFKDWKLIETGVAHGTYTFLSPSGSHLEVTSLRLDMNCDGRKADVAYTPSFQEDAKRRDFTVNALYIDKDLRVIDYVDGVSDCANRILKTVGNPFDRFEEDYLRILRAIRFSLKYDLEIDCKTAQAIASLKNEIFQHVSPERIWMEMSKVVKSIDRLLTPHNISMMFDRYDIMNLLIENNICCVNCTSRFHKDVFNIIKENPELFWAQIFYESCFTKYEIDKICDRYKVSNKERKNIHEYHQLSLRLDHYIENIDDIYEKIQDSIQDGFNPKIIAVVLHHTAHITHAKQVTNDVLNGVITKKEFPVTGQDIINKGVRQGKEVGIILSLLYELWKKSDYTMTKDDILKHVS